MNHFNMKSKQNRIYVCR